MCRGRVAAAQYVDVAHLPVSPLWEGPDILSIPAYFRMFLMFVAY